MLPSEGMLFIMPTETKMGMWMKDCLIPLDVLFFDRDRRLINFHTMVPPSASRADRTLPIYSSDKPAKYALEIPAGTAERLGLGRSTPIPTTIVFSMELLKRLAEGTE